MALETWRDGMDKKTACVPEKCTMHEEQIKTLCGNQVEHYAAHNKNGDRSWQVVLQVIGIVIQMIVAGLILLVKTGAHP